MKENLVDKPLFRLFIPIPLGILVYFVLLLINDDLSVLEESFISQELFFCIGLTYATFEINRLSNKILAKWNLSSNLLIVGSFVFNILLTILLTYVALSVYFIYIVGFSSFSISSNEMQSFGLIMGMISVLYNMIYLGYYYLNKQNEEQFTNEQILKDQIEFELKSYQSELRPNLFFDSLESAIDLLHENPDEAEYFLDKLAMVYRYVLLNREKSLIDIHAEIKASKELLYLLNKKYDGHISLKADIDAENSLVVPGTLPNLLEEIVNSTIISRTRPLRISYFIEDGYLNIRYELNDRLNPQLENTFKQLQDGYTAVTDQPLMKVQAYGECYYKIPLISDNVA